MQTCMCEMSRERGGGDVLTGCPKRRKREKRKEKSDKKGARDFERPVMRACSHSAVDCRTAVAIIDVLLLWLPQLQAE